MFNLLNEIIPVYQPSLLHGDLWSGNFLIDHNGHACIIDPAVYYGNREADIAMTKLFGGFSQEFYSNYNDYLPMLNGWQERIPIWNLYPLLVHANLFGSSYLNQINSHKTNHCESICYQLRNRYEMKKIVISLNFKLYYSVSSF